MADFPSKGLFTIVSIENFLFAFDTFISRDSEKIREDTDFGGFFIILIYIFASFLSVAFLNKLKLRGRKRYLLESSLVLAACYFASSFIVSISRYPRYVIEAVFLTVKMFSKASMLTMILSVISIQKYETGFYFGFQVIVAKIFFCFGVIFYFLISNEAIINYVYYVIIFLFMGSVYFVYQKLSEEHEEIDKYPFSLFFDMAKVPLFFYDFLAFSLALGVSEYSTSILFKVYNTLSVAVIELIILAMITSYPITLAILYKKFRPINPKFCIPVGLFFMSLSLVFMIPAYTEIPKVFLSFSAIFSQIGLVLIAVSSLPNMLKNSEEILKDIEFGILSDRVCSLVYDALYFGLLIIYLFVLFFKNFISYWFGMVLAALILLFFSYFYYKKSSDYLRSKNKESLLFYGEELADKVDLSMWLN